MTAIWASSSNISTMLGSVLGCCMPPHSSPSPGSSWMGTFTVQYSTVQCNIVQYSYRVTSTHSSSVLPYRALSRLDPNMSWGCHG